ncbi:MAG TPA: hypothetical protein VMW15_09285 [Terracidiphilus sp.]|nr:hypothetical protein [Terracidiphilus sp.]
MTVQGLRGLVLLIFAAPGLAFAGGPKQCITADQASRFLNKDICIAAHIYDVVQLPNGTRFLDVCTPDTPDARCHFTIESLWEDHGDVGELSKYKDTDVRVRGLVQPMHGRVGMMLSNARQFHGGPPKFRPNPRLAHGFSAEESRPPVSDPNLRSQGSHRAFMNTRNQETRPAN